MTASRDAPKDSIESLQLEFFLPFERLHGLLTLKRVILRTELPYPAKNVCIKKEWTHEDDLRYYLIETYPLVKRLTVGFYLEHRLFTEDIRKDVIEVSKLLWRLKDRCEFTLKMTVSANNVPDGEAREAKLRDCRIRINEIFTCCQDDEKSGSVELDTDGSRGFGTKIEYISWL
jgi:hypothetical protein